VATIKVLDSEHATLWFHEESGVVHHQFKKYVYGAPFREVLERGLDLMNEKKARKWLSDDRKNSALIPQDAEWAQSDWSPRVHAAGWKYWAIVLPENVIGKMNMQQFIDDQSSGGVTVQVFSDPNQALGWLESV
jgi:hypothetical protein